MPAGTAIPPARMPFAFAVTACNTGAICAMPSAAKTVFLNCMVLMLTVNGARVDKPGRIYNACVLLLTMAATKRAFSSRGGV